MKTLHRVCGVAAALVVLSCMLACGSVREAAARQKATNDLKQLSLSYHNFVDTHNGQGPSGPDEWSKFAVEPQEKALIEMTRPGGQFVFYWKVKIGDLAKAGGASNTVLGHESKVPTDGGLVPWRMGPFA